MNVQPLTNEEIINLLGHYKKNLQCLSQLACSEGLNLIEALSDNLIIQLSTNTS